MKVIIATIFPNENFFRMPYTWKKMPFFLLVTSRHCISMGNNDSINSRAIFYLYFTSYHFLRNSWILGGTRKQGAWIRDFRFEKPLVIISRISSQRVPPIFARRTCLRIKRASEDILSRPPLALFHSAFWKGQQWFIVTRWFMITRIRSHYAIIANVHISSIY